MDGLDEIDAPRAAALQPAQADRVGLEPVGDCHEAAPAGLSEKYVVGHDPQTTTPTRIQTWPVRGSSPRPQVLPHAYPFFPDAACNVPLTETPVVDNAAFEESGIFNLAVQYKGEYFAPGNVLTADSYWKPGLGGPCQLFDREVRGLGAQLQKPADFIGRISVVAR